MEKNNKKLDLAKKIAIEDSKIQLLEKQLELSGQVYQVVEKELNSLFMSLGIEVTKESGEEGTFNSFNLFR